VWALCDAVPDRYRAGILLSAFTGLQVAEACGLRVADVDFMRGIIHPAVQYPAEPLKTEVSRTAVPIAASMAAELSAHVAQWRAETLLTNAEHGGQLGRWVLERVVRAARDRAGLPAGFRYHDLRHYFASLLIASGSNVKIVQARLRHASAATTLDTYGHLWPDSDGSTRAAVESVFADRADKRKIVIMSVQVTAPARATRRSTGRTRRGAGAAATGRSRSPA
jgi:integrase